MECTASTNTDDGGGGGGMVQNMQRATYEKWPPSRRPAIEQTRLNTSK